MDPQLEIVFKQLAKIKNQLHQNPPGLYRGYLKVALGDEILALERLLLPIAAQQEKMAFAKSLHDILRLFNDFMSQLPRNKQKKILGYFSIDAGKIFFQLYNLVAASLDEPLHHYQPESIIAELATRCDGYQSKIDDAQLKSQSLLQGLTNQIQENPEEEQTELLEKIIAEFEKNNKIFTFYNFNHNTLLTECVIKEANALLKMLVTQCPKKYLLAENRDGTTALHEAVARGHLDALDILIDALSKAQRDALIPTLTQVFHHVPYSEIETVIAHIESKTGITLQNTEYDEYDHRLSP